MLDHLIEQKLYTRPMSFRQVDGRKIMWDDLSAAPMSTQHANARFLVPHLARTGWALFVDGDVMALDNLGPMFDGLDEKFALYCVHHDHEPVSVRKMDGQVQTKYTRKNWSSVMIFNCDHPANRALTLEMINSLPGRDLHRFCWLADDEIGELPAEYNYLVGHTRSIVNPKIVHFTSGTPDMPGYENCEYADEWREQLMRNV